MAELTVAERVAAMSDTASPEWLAAWAQGYCEGWSARNTAIVGEWLWYFAEDLAALDRSSFDGPAREHWRRRIEREVADDRHARRLRFDDPDWPPVAVPGVPGVRLGGSA